MPQLPRRRSTKIHLIFLALLLALPLLACADSGQQTTEETTAETPPDQVITVLGRVRQLPDPEHRGRQLIIAHEAIPDFRDDRGEPVGMPAMTMPFPIADPALLEGVAIGDAIRFVFESRAHDGPPLVVTAVERLPEGTELAFEAAASERDPSAPSSPSPEEVAPTDEATGDGDHEGHAH